MKKTAQSPFDSAFNFTLGNEGGYSNVKGDAGGPTMWGITMSELSRWRNKPVSTNDVKALTQAEAKLIYKAWYWNAMDLDSCTHPSVAMAMFDIGVVCGIGQPPLFAQRICNAHGSHLNVDGHLGPLTFAAINAISPAAFIRDFSTDSENNFRAIAAAYANDRQFLTGWLNRARRLLTLVSFGAHFTFEHMPLIRVS